MHGLLDEVQQHTIQEFFNINKLLHFGIGGRHIHRVHVEFKRRYKVFGIYTAGV